MANVFHKNLVGDDLHIAKSNVGSATPVGSQTAGVIGELFYDSTANRLYIAEATGTANWIDLIGESDSFLELGDTPSSYSGNAGEILVVNSGASAVVFTSDIVLATLQVTGTLKDTSGDVGTSGQVLSSTVTGTNWVTSGAGDVIKVGTPANNQVGVWTGDGTIEGASGLTWNGSTLSVSGRTRLADGTELLPTHSFSNDFATGMRLSAVNILNFSARGFDVLQLTAEAVSLNFVVIEATASNSTDGVKMTAAATASNVVFTIASKGTGELRLNAGGSDGNVSIGRTGSTTAIKSDTVTVVDKNLTIGNVTTPTDVTADGGGFTLKGATDKTINWVNSTDRWTFNQGIELETGGDLFIKGTGTGQISTTSGITLDIQPVVSGLAQFRLLTSGGVESLVVRANDGGSKSIAATGAGNFLISSSTILTLSGATTVDISAATTVSIDTDGADTVAILDLENTGTNAGEKKIFLGSRTPVGNVTGTPGDQYDRTSTTTSTIYIHRGASANNTSWVDIGVAATVTKVGTPLDNQVAVWTGDGTIEGESGLTYNSNALDLTGTFNTSENISIPNSKTIRFNGISDANWAIGRDAVVDTGGLVTSQSLQIITGNSAGEGFQILNAGSLVPVFEIRGDTGIGAYNGGFFGFGTGATAATVAVDVVGDIKTTGTIEAGDNISIPTTKNIRFNGVSDTDWKMGRNTVPDSGGLVTGNSLQILFADAATEGFQILSSIDNTPIFEINGATKVGTYNGGNFGFGTGATAALGTLHVKSSGSATTAASFADDLVVENSSDVGMILIAGDNQNAHIILRNQADSTSATIRYRANGEIFNIFVGSASKTLAISGSGTFSYDTDKITVNSDGEVGIGTASAETKLHVISPTADTVAVVTTETTGTNLGESATFIGSRTPSGNVTAAGGAVYLRDSGATSGSYESREITTGTGWFKRSVNPTTIVEINTSAEFEALASGGVITVAAGINLTIVMNFTVVTSSRFVVEAGAALDITGRRTAGAGIAYTGTATFVTVTSGTIQFSDSLTVTAVSTGTLIAVSGAGSLADFEGVVLFDWDNLGTFSDGIFLMRFVNMVSCTAGFTITNFALLSVFNATHLGVPMTSSLFTVTTNVTTATGVFDAILATLSSTGSVVDFDTRMSNGIQINVQSVDATLGAIFRPATLSDATINSVANAAISAGAITVQASNGSGGTRHTCSTTYFEDEEVVITGTTSYNGTFQIFGVVAGVSFDTVTTFVADDATGTVNTSRIEMTLAASHGVTTGMNIKVNGTDAYNGFYTVLNLATNVITLNQVVGTPITDTGTINRDLSIDETDSRVNAFNNLATGNSGARAFGEVNANTQITTITDGTYAVINMSLMVNNGISSRFKLINTITGIWEYTATEPFNGRLGAITNFLKTGSTQDYRIVFTIDGAIPTFATAPYQPAEMTTTKKSQTIENFVTMNKGQTFQLMVAGDGTGNTCTFTDVTITATG